MKCFKTIVLFSIKISELLRTEIFIVKLRHRTNLFVIPVALVMLKMDRVPILCDISTNSYDIMKSSM